MPHAQSHARYAGSLLDRRRLLQIGGLGCFGLYLARFFEAQATAASPPAGRVPRLVGALILLYHYGGPSHLDAWDLKPLAPREIRGEFQPIVTRTPGIHISEHLPRCARVMDKLAIVRSLHHPMRNHNAAAVESLCGR